VAWPTPADILRALPLDTFEDAEGKLSAEDVQGYIDGWKGRLAQGSSEAQEPPETPTGRDAVARGARADAMEQLFPASGFDTWRAVDGMRKEAYRLLEMYRQEVNVPGETTYESSSQDVENFTEEPLWPTGEDASYRPSWAREFYG